MKRRKEDLSREEQIRTLDALYTAASSVQGRKAMKGFLRDLLTESERIMLGRRILIARLLLSGETYDAVRERTGAGPATIGRVHHWLKDQLPGYEEALAGMDAELEKRDMRKKYATSALYRLKKRYPLHFLLFPNPK
jgi:uncharacterized protein YerC